MKQRVARTSSPNPARAKQNGKLATMEAVAGEFKSFRPASEALTDVRAVPTVFVQFDKATMVGGYPIERVTLVHGPSQSGKTYFLIGLMLSFVKLGHPVLFLDVERTTPIAWLRKAMGEHAGSPIFFAENPQTYERAVLRVREFCNLVARMRASGKLGPDATGLVVVDSIRKLSPDDHFRKITEQLKRQDPNEKVRDRSAQVKAAMNALWMDELVPLLGETKTAMAIVARETDDPDADARSRMFGSAYKIGGGRALFYDASLVVRVEQARFVTKEPSAEGVRPTVYGVRHRLTIRKSKVSGRGDEKYRVGHFHTSTGTLVPEGFDRARDVLEVARALDVVEGTSWLRWGKSRWQGEHAAVKKLTADPATIDAIEAECRALFKNAGDS